jgi:hypothetical protein
MRAKMGLFGALIVVRNWLLSRWREAVLAAASIVLTCLVLEIGYRAYQYSTLPDRLAAAVAAQSSTTRDARDPYTFDTYTGHRYTPHLEGQRGFPWFSHWRTNSHGHVSQFEYPRRKPPGEYRIAVVGDSMTANITNNVRWTEVVEERLNASPQWRASVGGQFTRVINFGIDGMGMEQFGAIARYHAMDFEPDLVMVNFISDDIYRPLRYARTPYQGETKQTVETYVRRNFLDRIDWFSLRPELFAATVGRLWGMRSSLPVDTKAILASTLDRYPTREAALAASATAVRDMLTLAHPIFLLQMPQFEEVEGGSYPMWDGLVDDFQQAVPRMKIVSMNARMRALLEGKTPQDRHVELSRWFYVPHDRHYSDYGTTLYAREVAGFLIEHAGSWQAADHSAN